MNGLVIRILDIEATYFDRTEHPYILSDIHMIHLLGDTLRRSHIDKPLYIPHRMCQVRKLQNITTHHDYLIDSHYTCQISSPIHWSFFTYCLVYFIYTMDYGGDYGCGLCMY